MTNAELALLSLVAERPAHGYDLEHRIVERNMRDWTEVGFSSIYYVMDRLEKAGLATSWREPAPGRGPARRVYAATDEGVAALRRHALEALARPARDTASFQLALSVLPMLDEDEVSTALADHEHALVNHHDLLEERSAGPLPFHVEAMFDLAKTQVQAELSWVRGFAHDFDQYRRRARRSS